MWKSIYKKLNDLYLNKIDLKLYCETFLSILSPNEKLMKKEEVENYLKENGTDLFPESINFHNAFNNGDYRFIASYIYHFNDIDLEWYDTNARMSHLSSEEKYKLIFKEDNEEFIFNKAIFEPEIMLSETNRNRQLTFLFLLFLPEMNNYQIFFHYKKKIPLLCCSFISNENFEMLLCLMTEFIADEIKLYSISKNLNHILIEDFMQTSAELYAFDCNTDWFKLLPIYKMHRLFEINCRFANFHQTMDEKYYMTFPNMPDIVFSIEKEYDYLKLNKELKIKTEVIETNIQKI